MKVKFQQEDIKLLSSLLQEQLLREFPGVTVLQVRCAVKNDKLMVLTEHPPGVSFDTDQVFHSLEESLQWQSQYHEENVQLYVRISGEKLPYAKHSITIKGKGIEENQELHLPELSHGKDHSVNYQPLIFPPQDTSEPPFSQTQEKITNNPFSLLTDEDISDHSFSSHTEENIQDTSFSTDPPDPSFSSERSFGSDPSFSSDSSERSFGSDTSFSSDTILGSDTSFRPDVTFESKRSYFDDNEEDAAQEEIFDPLEGAKNLSPGKTKLLPPLPIILGISLGIIVMFGGGAFFLIRSCVIGECKELQTAQQLKTQSQQQIRQAKSEKELIPIQQKLDQVVAYIQKIPQFSSRYQEAQELSSSLSEQSAKINLVIKALQTASTVEQQSQTPATSLDELRNRQALWRQAITPLESIKPGSELNALAKTYLPKYKNNLETINKQLLNEETWQKKLTTAKTVADATTKKQAAAKSASDWQRVEFAWREVVNSLTSIPKTSAAHQEAKNLLVEYQPQLRSANNTARKEKSANQTYQQAVNFANQAKIYEQKNQWQAAVASWEQALQTVNQIPQDTSTYTQVQSIKQSYSTALVQAQEKFQLFGNLTQTRADLDSTCFNKTRFCNFTIEDKGIIVRLTPTYDQALLNNGAGMQNHFQTLQKALSVISDNSNLPVVLYNSQGQERYMKKPQ